MANTKLVMVRVWDENDLRTLLGADTNTIVINRILAVLKGAYVAIPNQPEHLNNQVKKGLEWVEENAESRGLKRGDLYRPIILKGASRRVTEKNDDGDEDDVDAMVETPIVRRIRG